MDEQQIQVQPEEQPAQPTKDYDPSAYKPETVYAQKAKGGLGRTFLMILGVIAVIVIIMVIGGVLALYFVK